MKALLLLLSASLVFAQDAGEQAFAQTCGSGYCHNGRGGGGGAPRLAARGFEMAYIRNTVTNGVPGTSMPAFGQSLAPAQLNAIVTYVAGLNGIAAPQGGRGSSPIPAQPKLSAEAARGKALFSDAVRGFGRCSTCHEADGIGIPVAPPIFTIPANAAAMKALATPRVSTVTVSGEQMPGLVIASRSTSVIFYDLTTTPPVKRTVEPAAFQNREGSTWRHASVIGSYNDAELTAVLAFLRAVRR